MIPLSRGSTRILSVSENFLIFARIAPEEGAVIAFNLAGSLPIRAHALYGSPTGSALLLAGQPLQALDEPTTEIPPGTATKASESSAISALRSCIEPTTCSSDSERWPTSRRSSALAKARPSARE